MTGANAVRGLLAAVGLALLTVGGVLMLESGRENVVRAAFWLAGGVAVHDVLLAPVTIVLVVIAARFLPDWARAPATIGFVVLATVTVVAIPVLGRFGARPDNPTLLDRNYLMGWLIIAIITSLAVGATVLRGRRRARVEGHP